MLSLKAHAEIIAIVPNIEYHGEDTVKSVAVRLLLKAVPLEQVEKGFVGQLNLFYGVDELLRIADIEPEIRVTRAIDNVDVKIRDFSMHGRVRKVKVRLNARKLCDVSVTVIGELEKGLDMLHNDLRKLAPVELTEVPQEVAATRAA